ncbi:ABC-three component system protein [Streptomyces sp. cg40]|uniref:ABC-three component system protein n=1 Tax=Streptomyces sp. cg40 TaxID=3419764 RepID=UPI003CFEB832
MTELPCREEQLPPAADTVSPYTIPAQAVAPNPFDTRTPLQQVFFWSPVQWEEFTCEWVRLRAKEEGYLGVEIIGGSNDRGADVVAFQTEQKLNGPWHCYQCKRYERELTLAQALPEMLKPFVAAVETSRTLPTRYFFVAPRIAPRLVDAVLTPQDLKQRFLEHLNGRPQHVRELDPGTLARARELAEATDFTMFWTVNLATMLELYAQTPMFPARFNLPPTGKPDKLVPPEQPDTALEARFLEQLLRVYQEYFDDRIHTLADAFAHRETGPHLGRQREALYAAEALRMFARDSVPGEVYQELQADVLVMLVEVAMRRFPTGFDRLQSVLERAGVVQTHSPMLHPHFKNLERIGMCHQFANDDKLTWCREEAAE